MKKITATLYPEGTNHRPLIEDMKSWHQQHPFKNGVNFDYQYFWAELTDEDCLAFCLKYPEYQSKFKDV
jgi:hypothetical protein